jgi:spore germination cell wall hydrolase CwlJ-like protein
MVGQSQQRYKVAQLAMGVFLLGLLTTLLVLTQMKYEGRVVEKVTSVETPYTLPQHPLEYSVEDVFYLAQAIYFEARSEPEECQFQVAHVIDTRRYSYGFPNTIKEVIWQGKQFSYTEDGKHERVSDTTAWDESVRIAKLVLGGYSLDTTEGSLYYYNPDLANPTWKDGYQVVNKCGKHLFLKDKDKGDWS